MNLKFSFFVQRALVKREALWGDQCALERIKKSKEKLHDFKSQKEKSNAKKVYEG